MGTTAEKLQAIVSSKADIGAAITEKGGTVPRKLSEYGAAIRALPSGGGPTPLDATKVYNVLRSGLWPPMPTDIPDHTVVFLFVSPGSAAFTVTCEGQYTVEVKTCKKTGDEWAYTIESTESLDSGVEYTKDFSEGTAATYRLMTISASSISAFTLSGSINDDKMPGCVELLFRLPAAPNPVCAGMTDLTFASGIGPFGTAKWYNVFNRCPSLICARFPDAELGTESAGNAFKGCENVIAIDVLVNENNAFVANSFFPGCGKLISVPTEILHHGTAFAEVCRDCASLVEVSIRSGVNGGLPFRSSFSGCLSLEKLVISGSFSITSMSNTFKNCISLRHLIFNLPNWVGSDFSIENCAFGREGLVEMFQSLPSITTQHSITITGNPGVADLTEEDKAIATAKNWALVG